jgi:hypothetical protein
MLLSSLAAGGGDEEDAGADDEAADMREGPCTSIRNEIHQCIIQQYTYTTTIYTATSRYVPKFISVYS